MTKLPCRLLTRRARALILAMATALWPSLLPAQVSREPDLKAVFLFNFGQYVTWPEEAFAGPASPFIIGFLGSTPVDEAIMEIVENETIQKRPILIRRYGQAEDIGACHVLFISSAESFRLSYILERLRARPILTVSDIRSFTREGGVIELYPDQGKMRLVINNNAAKAAGLAISPRLLKVAARAMDSEAQK